MNSLDIIPTRTALLELREERELVDEAFEFLDEKRLLLAAEILRQLAEYEKLKLDVQRLGEVAARELAATLGRHGLQGASVYPTLKFTSQEVIRHESNFMGVILSKTAWQYQISKLTKTGAACNASAEAQSCRQAFFDLAAKSAELAGYSGNLYRLLLEYRLTERRARALENVILPEIEQTLTIVNAHIEELDLEETVRTRLRLVR